MLSSFIDEFKRDPGVRTLTLFIVFNLALILYSTSYFNFLYASIATICFLISHLFYMLVAAGFLLTALGFTALYSCPSEDSFHVWLEDMMKLQAQRFNAVSQRGHLNENQPTIQSRIYNMVTRYLQRKVQSYLVRMDTEQNVNFMNWGFFRQAYCTNPSNDTELPAVFIGVFGTWIPR